MVLNFASYIFLISKNKIIIIVKSVMIANEMHIYAKIREISPPLVSISGFIMER